MPNSADQNVAHNPCAHPLASIFEAAILQATKGKGIRHGGDTTPFLEQPWVHYAKMHGKGFLTGQAAKKLEEAASNQLDRDAYERELLGAINYIGMALLFERQLPPREVVNQGPEQAPGDVYWYHNNGVTSKATETLVGASTAPKMPWVPTFNIGDRVEVYDRHRFAVPVSGVVSKLSENYLKPLASGDLGVAVVLTSTSNPNYGLASEIWVDARQLRHL